MNATVSPTKAERELEILRRLARVANQLMQAEAKFIRTRETGDKELTLGALLELRDQKHQMRRVLTELRHLTGGD